jgi:hypothetical protein
MTFRLVRVRVVLSWALIVWLLPALVCARAAGQQQGAEPAGDKAGSGQEEQKPAGQEGNSWTMPPDTVAPQPAGVGSSAAPDAPAASESDDAGENRVSPLDAKAFGALSGRPFNGVFAGAEPRGLRKHRLDLSASAFGVHVRGANPGLSPDSTDVLEDGRSTYAGGSASLSYGRNWTNGSFGADGTASLAYIPDYEGVMDPWIDRWSVGSDGAYSRQLSRKLRFGAAGQLYYSPYYQQDFLFSSGAPTIASPALGAPGLDFVVARQPSVTTSGRTSLTYAFSTRSSLDTFYEVNDRRFTSGDLPSQYDQSAGVRYARQFNRFVGMHAGYAYRYGRYGTADDRPIKDHRIDVGVDGGYGRSFALARRTTFSFNTGSGIAVTDSVRQDAEPDTFDPDAHFFLTGSADLLHSWARTWSANAGYRRGLSYEAGFSQPLLSDSAFAGIAGLLAPRVDFTAGLQYTNGSVGFTGADRGYANSSAYATLRTALTSNLAAYAQYFYYHTNFETGVVLPSFVQRSLDRQGVTVGVTASVPLINSRGRR